jgi:putative transposase
MPRAVRIQYAGALYHVLCRGDRREDIFLGDGDRNLFLLTLSQACERTGFRIHSYVLMSNHYHLLVETPEPNLVEGMRWLQGTYTARFNTKHRLAGHLFQGRYKAIPIEGEEPSYFQVVSDYIHLNPARAGLLDREKPELGGYRWSSFPHFIRSGPLPDWLVRRRLFSALGLPKENQADRRAYIEYMQGRVQEVLAARGTRRGAEQWSEMRRGWYVGGEEFRDRLMELAEGMVKGRLRRSYEGQGLERHDTQTAGRMLKRALRVMGLDVARVRGLRQNDPRKQAVAWLLKSQTMVSAEWIGRALEMGDGSNIRRAAHAYRTPDDYKRKRLKKRLLHICRD